MIKIIKEIVKFFLNIEFVRFGIVGVVNTIIDYGLMNFFLFIFNIEKGIIFALIKILTISLAIMVSYFLNKKWTFKDDKTSRSKFIKFVLLSILVIFVNVLIAGILFEYVEVNFDKRIWANMASILGAIIAIIVKYFGSRKIFKNIDA